MNRLFYGMCATALLIALGLACCACSPPAPAPTAPPTVVVPTVTPTFEVPRPTPTIAVPPTPTPEPTRSIRVTMVEPVRRNLDSVEITMKNCGVNTEWRQKLPPELDVQQSLGVGPQAAPVSTGRSTNIPESLRAELAAEVQLAYRQAFEAAKAGRDAIELVSGPDKHFIYKLLWVQDWYTATLSYSTDGIACTAPYTYALRIPKQAGFLELGCTG